MIELNEFEKLQLSILFSVFNAGERYSYVRPMINIDQNAKIINRIRSIFKCYVNFDELPRKKMKELEEFLYVKGLKDLFDVNFQIIDTNIHVHLSLKNCDNLTNKDLENILTLIRVQGIKILGENYYKSDLEKQIVLATL